MKLLKAFGKFLLAFGIIALFNIWIVEMMKLRNPYFGLLVLFTPVTSLIGAALLMLYHRLKPRIEFKYLLLMSPLFAVFGYAVFRIVNGIFHFV